MEEMKMMVCLPRNLMDQVRALVATKILLIFKDTPQISTLGKSFHSEIQARELPNTVKVSQKY